MPSTVRRGILSAMLRCTLRVVVSPSELTKACDEVRETVGSGSGETSFGDEA